MTMTAVPPRPRMPTATDEKRAERGMTRHLILVDDYDDLAAAYVGSRYASPDLAAVIGEPDTSANILASLARQLTTPGLYGVRPEVRGPDGSDGLIGTTGQLAAAGWLTRMPHVQFLALGLGDVFVRWDAPAGGSDLLARVVMPYDVYLEAPPDAPDRPHLLMERRPREIDGVYVWCWDVYDVRSSEGAAYRVVRCAPGRSDVRGEVTYIGDAVCGADESWLLGMAGARIGPDYPFARPDGSPRLPFSRYRWSDQGALWNDLQMRSATKATLAAMFLWTLVGHGAKSLAMGKFYLAHNLTLPAEQVVDQRYTSSSTTRIATVTVLPGSMVTTTPTDSSQPAQVFEMGPSGDVVSLLSVASAYELMAAMRFGLAPGDLGQSANPTSAAALTISAAGRRAAAAQCEEVFRAADIETIACAADVLRSAGVADYPSTGYTIAYHRIARTPDEDQAERDEIDWAVKSGQMGPIEAYRRRHPGVDEATARAALIAAAKERADIERAVAAYVATPPPAASPDPTTDPED